MAQTSLKSLVSKLNETSRSTLEGAAGLALSRTNYEVEVEHWLLRLIDRARSDVGTIISHFEIDAGRLTQDINRQIDRFKTGNGKAPSLAPSLVKLIREAWLQASLDGNRTQIRSGDLLLAMLDSDDPGFGLRELSTQFAKIPVDTLRKSLTAITVGSEEGGGCRNG
jgi:type VI secretion system protein VasG